MVYKYRAKVIADMHARPACYLTEYISRLQNEDPLEDGFLSYSVTLKRGRDDYEKYGKPKENTTGVLWNW